MLEVKRFKRFEDFVSFNGDFLNENPMLYHFPITTINQVYNGKVKLHDFLNIIDESEKRVFLLFAEDYCLVYGNCMDEEFITTLSKEIEFAKFKRFQFAGNKNIIDSLFRLNNAEYELQKHRIIYRCKQVNSALTYSPGQIEMGDINRLEELANFSIEFNEAYYGEKKSLEHMKEVVFQGIMNGNFYQWNYENNVCSIAQRIDEDYDFPVIGHFYTPPAFRNQGFGSSLIHRLTKGILDLGNEFCMLSTNALTPASNKVFVKVGYEITGEYLLAYKAKF